MAKKYPNQLQTESIKYSGKFQVRITPERHRMLAIQAAEQNVSLNRYISDKLAV